MPTYRWDSPREWLDEKIDKLANAGDANGLHEVLIDLLPNIDSDIVQNIYQSEMDEDGFFEDLDEKDRFRDRIHQWIENETNFLHLVSRKYEGPKMTHEDYLRVHHSTSVDELYYAHDGDIEEAIAELS